MNYKVDTATLTVKFNGKFDLLKKIYDEFSLHIDTVIPEMITAYEAEDLKTLEEKAHTLKGNAALIGATRVRELALKVQEASSNGNVQSLSGALSQLYNEAQEALKELDSFISDQS
ncbi:MAG: Hpt domain-containing protein [Desulfohalobiaceae bacterium]